MQRRLVDTIIEYTECLIIHLESDQRVVKLDRRPQVINAFYPGNFLDRLEMRPERAVQPGARVVVEATPDDTAHNGMKIVAVGAALPAQQTAVLQRGERTVQLTKRRERLLVGVVVLAGLDQQRFER